MVTVYRVEHPSTGVGPYNHRKALLRGMDINNDDDVLAILQYRRDYDALADLLNEHHRPGEEHDGVRREGVFNKVDEAMFSLTAAYNVEVSEVFCACPTRRDLEVWFTGFWDLLEELGFVVVEYQVSHVYSHHSIGSNQVLIWKGKN